MFRNSYSFEMKTKIVLVDLDLTLLHSDGSLSERNVNALKKCQERGILVGFCTSRGTTRIKQFADVVRPELWICNAGATIYFRDELIHAESFSLEETRGLLAKVYEVCGPEAEITVDTINDFFWNRTENKTTQYMPEANFDDFRDFSVPAMKFCVQTSDKVMAESIVADFPNCSAILFSDIPWYKFSPKSATKENAVAFLEKYFGIPAAQMISFGDDFADIGMLKATGVGVAMENAIPEVKAIASAHTLSCDEDGVADYLEKWILQ